MNVAKSFAGVAGAGALLLALPSAAQEAVGVGDRNAAASYACTTLD